MAGQDLALPPNAGGTGQVAAGLNACLPAGRLKRVRIFIAIPGCHGAALKLPDVFVDGHAIQESHVEAA